MFTHPSQLGDGPGPGTYEASESVQTNKGPSFGAASPTGPRRTTSKNEPQPGPGAYGAPMRADGHGAPSITMGSLSAAGRQLPQGYDLPGPGSYEQAQPTRKGGTISRHIVKSEMDFALERAAAQPGPGAYELNHLPKGQSSTMSGRTRGADDVLIAAAARRPGPGEYEMPKARVRGGAMSQFSREQSLPVLMAPGPGTYHQTPTVSQEREMRKLSRQVVHLVKSRGQQQQLKGTSFSAPEEWGRGSGSQAVRNMARHELTILE